MLPTDWRRPPRRAHRPRTSREVPRLSSRMTVRWRSTGSRCLPCHRPISREICGTSRWRVRQTRSVSRRSNSWADMLRNAVSTPPADLRDLPLELLREVVRQLPDVHDDRLAGQAMDPVGVPAGLAPGHDLLGGVGGVVEQPKDLSGREPLAAGTHSGSRCPWDAASASERSRRERTGTSRSSRPVRSSDSPT